MAAASSVNPVQVNDEEHVECGKKLSSSSVEIEGTDGSAFIMLDSGCSEDVEEKAAKKLGEKASTEEKIAEATAVIAEATAVIAKHELIKAKMAEKDESVKHENYAEAQRLKQEILDLQTKMTSEEKAVAEQKEKDEYEKNKKKMFDQAWKNHRRMERLTNLEIPSEWHNGHTLRIVIKHNGQIQWTTNNQIHAGFSEGEARTPEQVLEFEPKVHASC